MHSINGAGRGVTKISDNGIEMTVEGHRNGTKSAKQRFIIYLSYKKCAPGFIGVDAVLFGILILFIDR